MQIVAVGDIHGCFDMLAALMRTLAVDDADTLVFLGDYIDRGPDGAKVVDYLIQLRDSRNGETIFLKGNHEVMLLDYLSGVNQDRFLFNGGLATVASYTTDGVFAVPPVHMKFFRNLRPLYETEHYIFVHAGLRPDVPLAMQSEHDYYWIRGDFLFGEFDFGKKVIFGHTPMKSHAPYIDAFKIGIDTGAVYGGKLTAISLPEEKFYQV